MKQINYKNAVIEIINYMAFKIGEEIIINNDSFESKCYSIADDLIRKSYTNFFEVYKHMKFYFNEEVNTENVNYFIILESEECIEIIKGISVDDYKAFNKNSAENYLDCVNWASKIMAEKVLETMSAVQMIEYNDLLYISEYGAYENKEDFLSEIHKGTWLGWKCSLYCNILQIEAEQINRDFREMGEDFYLNEYECFALGL